MNKKTRQHLLNRVNLYQYLTEDMAIDWVECYWNGNLAGLVMRKFYRGNIKRVFWIDEIPIITLCNLQRYYPCSDLWRKTRPAMNIKQFDFSILTRSKIRFNFEVVEEQLKFNILDNITGIVSSMDKLQKKHPFTLALGSET